PVARVGNSRATVVVRFTGKPQIRDCSGPDGGSLIREACHRHESAVLLKLMIQTAEFPFGNREYEGFPASGKADRYLTVIPEVFIHGIVVEGSLDRRRRAEACFR